jgi:hypothetical protein
MRKMIEFIVSHWMLALALLLAVIFGIHWEYCCLGNSVAGGHGTDCH